MKRIVRFFLEHHDIFFYALMKHFHFLNVVTYIKHLLNGMGPPGSSKFLFSETPAIAQDEAEGNSWHRGEQ